VGGREGRRRGRLTSDGGRVGRGGELDGVDDLVYSSWVVGVGCHDGVSGAREREEEKRSRALSSSSLNLIHPLLKMNAAELESYEYQLTQVSTTAVYTPSARSPQPLPRSNSLSQRIPRTQSISTSRMSSRAS
jgi:hypothetical protein